MSQITIKILDEKYPVHCPEEHVEALKKAAAYLEKNAKKIKTEGKLADVKSILVMVAVNMASELLEAKEAAAPDKGEKILKQLHRQIDAALAAAPAGFKPANIH